MFSTPQDEEPVGFLSWNGTDVLSDLALWVLQGLFGVVPLKHKGGETPKSHPRRLTRESSMQGGDSFRLCNHISWARHDKGDYWAGRKLLWNQSTQTKQLIMIYFTGILFQNHWFNPKHFKYKKLDKSFYSSRLFLFNELVITTWKGNQWKHLQSRQNRWNQSLVVKVAGPRTK